MRNNLIKGTFLFDHNRYIFILTLTPIEKKKYLKDIPHGLYGN